MKRILAGVLALVSSVGLPFTPAIAATVNPTPSSSFAFDNTLAQHVRFDSLGRLWVWNNVSRLGQPETSPRLAIYTKEIAGWTQTRHVELTKVGFYNLRFAPDGTAYATNFKRNDIVTIPIDESGALGKARHFTFKGSTAPKDAFPAANNRLYVVFTNRVDEFRLPLKHKPRAIRTITMSNDNFPQVVATSDGTVFVMNGDTYNSPIRVFGPEQSGSATPVRTFLLDSAYASPSYSSDIALTNDGKIAVSYWGAGIGLFSANANGASVTPDTWYAQTAPVVNLQGVDFAASGAMAIADYDVSPSVKVFFEDGCVPRYQKTC